MDSEKWKFTEPDPAAPSPEQKERNGMIALLIFGIILFAGGLFFALKIGVFDIDYFFGIDKNSSHNMHKQALDYAKFFHAPWITGAVMITVATTHLVSKRK